MIRSAYGAKRVATNNHSNDTSSTRSHLGNALKQFQRPLVNIIRLSRRLDCNSISARDRMGIANNRIHMLKKGPETVSSRAIGQFARPDLLQCRLAPDCRADRIVPDRDIGIGKQEGLPGLTHVPFDQIDQHVNEDMGPHPVGQTVMDRPDPKTGYLAGSECSFYPGQGFV